MKPLVPAIPAHYTVAQLHKMKENATLRIADARGWGDHEAEMKMQAAITAIETRLTELTK